MIKDKRIFIKNIYYMLSYAFQALNQGEFENIAKESFDNIHDLFAAILVKGIGRQLKQGLYKEYIEVSDDLSVLRGKININNTIQHKISKRQLLSCEYDELSENNLLNQILKTTSVLLLKQKDVSSERKGLLKKELLFFSNVDEIDLRLIRWSSVRFQKNNISYITLIGICRLIIEGMLLTTEEGQYKLASFIDDQHMERLYEKFILEYYRKECPQINANASQINWALDDGNNAYLPIMQSDITLSKGSDVLIIDAKYYTHTMQQQYDSYSYHSNNLYQIFTYVKNKDAEFKDKPHRVSGMLLYAKTDEDVQPNSSYPMSGNDISIQTLDLNTDFSNIALQLNKIVSEYFFEN